MIMEITVGVIALAFMFLVIYLIIALRDVRKTLKKTQRLLTDLHQLLDAVSEPSKNIVHNVDKLTHDLRRKSEGLDILFSPLYALHKKQTENKISPLFECIGEAIRLFRKIKNEIID